MVPYRRPGRSPVGRRCPVGVVRGGCCSPIPPHGRQPRVGRPPQRCDGCRAGLSRTSRCERIVPGRSGGGKSVELSCRHTGAALPVIFVRGETGWWAGLFSDEFRPVFRSPRPPILTRRTRGRPGPTPYRYTAWPRRPEGASRRAVPRARSRESRWFRAAWPPSTARCGPPRSRPPRSPSTGSGSRDRDCPRGRWSPRPPRRAAGARRRPPRR